MDDIKSKPEAGASPTRSDASSRGAFAALAERRGTRRWLVQLFAQPVLLLAAGVALIASLGVAQRAGWISADSEGGGAQGGAVVGDTRTYICPMLCTPPQVGPGRCPVCEMDLVPAASGGGATDSRSVEIDPAARRVANIRTAPVQSVPLSRTVRAVGELQYDESSLKTISAYVDGRIDRLYADFTGVVVDKGDHLALVYSPQLYSAQVELLLSRKARDDSRSSRLKRVLDSNREMYESTRTRLAELGMTDEQIGQLEVAGKANSRLHLCAPISGTVIQKHATEGQYVKEGQPIYELADLSTVWLMLELFPEDAAAIRYGQRVDAQVQSLPGRTFSGRVAFVDPTVDPNRRTVGVRVVMPNDEGALRVGDYAKASVRLPVSGPDSPGVVYDPQLAGKWIGPRHPHVVEDGPGTCPICGVDLVPTSQFGFARQPSDAGEALVAPSSAVLTAGDHSVAYVESEPGRFEIRNLVLGKGCGDLVVVHEGLREGERVAVSGTFLIDSQMQLAGNPSLIDPSKAEPSVEFELDDADLPPIGDLQMVVEHVDQAVELEAQLSSARASGGESNDETSGLSQLSGEDKVLARQQGVCPVADTPLGSMGAPVKVLVEGRPVFICCEGCRAPLLAEPAKYLAKLRQEVVR